jgi:CheY-like chemotaxis protein
MALKSNKILIVEDEASLLNVLAKKFESTGFGVRTAEDGLKGLEAVKKEKPDLVLLDLIMPKMDGMTMLKILRDDKIINGTHVIILTNLNDPRKHEEAHQYGISDFLVKTDWKLEDIISKVRECLS